MDTNGVSQSQSARILIVEDEPAFRDILRAELIKKGYDVVVASNGQEGLEKMRSAQPALVLLDIVMPQRDGFWLLEQINADEMLQRIPVLVLSNSGDVVELSRAKDMGVKDILVKTEFGPQELALRVHLLLANLTNPQVKQEKTSGDALQSEFKEQEVVVKPETPREPPKAHVLVVEDDVFLWNLIESKLVKEGFGVSVAKDGSDCFTQVKAKRPSIILLDIVLPDMNGFEVLQKLKDDSQTSRIPVIILSNLGQQEDIARGIALGAKDYLIKAHHAPQEIVDKIKKVLEEE